MKRTLSVQLNELVPTDDLGIPVEVDFIADRRRDRGTELFGLPDQFGSD
jgi:hypothetical protein